MKSFANKEVTSRDAIIAFCAAEQLTKERSKYKHDKKFSVKKSLESIITELSSKTDKSLFFTDLGWATRFDLYVNSEWRLEEINLKDCGTWPEMSGLPEDFTYGNVIDTKNKVEEYLQNKNLLTGDTMKVLKIESLMKEAKTISKLLPIIVFEDHIIRHTRFSSKEQMKHYKYCRYDIDDGNHRAVALALLGEAKVMALVGKKMYKNPLMYHTEHSCSECR